MRIEQSDKGLEPFLDTGNDRNARLEILSVLAGGIAHDFNNLLTSILGNITLARKDSDPGDKVDQRLFEAEKALFRARELTQQLMSFSRGVEINTEPASVADVVRDAAALCFQGNTVRCHFDIADDLWPARIDESQIHQVISNLLINACEATDGEGVITITAENIWLDTSDSPPLESGDYVMLSVSDTGDGITEENLPKVFDPYFSTKSNGFGLGLANSCYIVNKHRGHISVASELGKGTKFTIYLPAVRDYIVKKKAERIAAGTIRQGNILVMDDEEIIRKLLVNMLEELGYQVSTACHGDEAVTAYREALASEHPFDAVILDLAVNGGAGGRETIRHLCKIDPAVCAIVSSGYSDDPVMANYATYGFCDVITKPYTLTELSATMNRVLENKSD